MSGEGVKRRVDVGGSRVVKYAGAISYGADGAGTTGYSLVLGAANVNSGLHALGVGGAQGAQIVLNQAGNVITGSAAGTAYFTIT